MELLVVFVIAVIGVAFGFLLGKRASGWCPQCGRSVARMLRGTSPDAR